MQAAAPSVLTVEDDPTVRADLHVALEDAGFDVTHASTGGEALEVARELEPDVIVIGRRESASASRQILEERRVPIVELARPFSSSQVVDAVTGALAVHTARVANESRATSLRSIESLVENLSFATPSPDELEQNAWRRGHVWRRVDAREQDDR